MCLLFVWTCVCLYGTMCLCTRVDIGILLHPVKNAICHASFCRDFTMCDNMMIYDIVLITLYIIYYFYDNYS